MGGGTVRARNITVGGNLGIYGGTVNAREVSAASVGIVGTGTNRFSGTVTATTGDIEIKGGFNTFENSLIASTLTKKIAFTGGASTFGDGTTKNIELNSASAIGISGADTRFILTDKTTLDAKHDLTFSGGSIMELSGNAIITATGTSRDVNFTTGAKMNLGVNTLEMAADTVTFNGANINIRNAASYGKLDVTGALLFSGSNTTVYVGGSNLKDLEGQWIIQADSITGDDLFLKIPLYAYTKVGNQIILNEYLGFSAGLEELAKDKGFNMSPNFHSANALMTRIVDVENNPQLTQKFTEFYTKASDEADGKKVKTAIQQLIGESTLGARQAMVDTAFKTQGAVLGRLDKIHTAFSGTPPSAGDSGREDRIWVGGFGSWNKQKDRDSVLGYDYNAGGFALGYDNDASALPLTLGAVTAFSFGKISSNNNLDEIDVDTISLGFYGSYSFDNGLFVDGNVGYGHARNKSTVNWVWGGQKTGSFNINSCQLGARTGMAFEAGDFNLTPSVGLRYLYTRQSGWSEALTKEAEDNFAIANWFAAKSEHQVDIPLNLTINTTHDSGTTQITTEFRLGGNFVAKRPGNEIQMGFLGSSDSATLKGISPSRATFESGAGVNVKLNDLVDAFVNYDLQVGSGFTGHNVSAGLGFQF